MSRPGEETVVDLLALYTAEYRARPSPATRTPGMLHEISVVSARFSKTAPRVSGLRLVGMSEVELERKQMGGRAKSSRANSWTAHGRRRFHAVQPRSDPAHGGRLHHRPWRLRAEPPVGRDGIRMGRDVRGAWVTAHELGHVMGLAHSARQGEAAGRLAVVSGPLRHAVGRPTTALGYDHVVWGPRCSNGVFSDPSRGLWMPVPAGWPPTNSTAPTR